MSLPCLPFDSHLSRVSSRFVPRKSKCPSSIHRSTVRRSIVGIGPDATNVSESLLAAQAAVEDATRTDVAFPIWAASMGGRILVPVGSASQPPPASPHKTWPLGSGIGAPPTGADRVAPKQCVDLENRPNATSRL